MADALFDREVERSRRAGKANMAIALVFFAAVFLLFPVLRGRQTASQMLAWDDGVFTLTLPDGESHAIPYDTIQGLELIEDPDYGECGSGTSDRQFKYGLWRNDALGEYVLCNFRSFQRVMQVTTADGIYWIGYESEATTASIYESFSEELLKN